MPVSSWSTTAANNTGILTGLTLDGAVMTVPQVDNAFRDMAAQIASQLGKLGFKGADIASATTTNLANATGWYLDITGSTTITGFGTVDAGQMFMLRFAGALTLTHNASSLILPGAANITTAAGDVAFMMSFGSGNWRCVQFQRASGVPLGGLPSSSTDNAVARFNGTAGAVQNSGVIVDDSNNITGVAALTATSFSGSGASLTALNATNLASGTVASARIAGSYTGITGTGALNAGSISSGFGNINIGASTFTTTGAVAAGAGTISGTLSVTGTLAGGNITASGNVDVDGSFRGSAAGGTTTLENLSSGSSTIVACFGGGAILGRPNGSASTAGQFVIADTGNVTVNGTLTVTG